MDSFECVEIDRKLAALLQGYPAIWDRKSPAFKVKSMKENSFRELSEKLKVPVTVVEDRYKSIREKFRKEKLKEEGETRSGSGQCSEPWELYEQLSFLKRNILTRRKRVTTIKQKNIQDFSPETANQSQTEQTDEEIEPTQDGFLTQTSEEERSVSPEVNFPSTSSNYSRTGDEPKRKKTPFIFEEQTPHSKRNKLSNSYNNSNEEIRTMVNSLTEAATKLISSPEKSSTFTWLGKFITETLDNMNEIVAEETAQKLTNLLFKKKISSLNNSVYYLNE